jgi:hypothetical protein
MTLNNSQEAIIDNRRRLVASCRLRQKATVRQICVLLEQQGVVNPESGKAWTIGTIQGDIQFLRKQWREEAQKDIAEIRSKQFAEYEELKQEAWKQKDLNLVLTALRQESKLLGSDAPQNIELTIKKELDTLMKFFEDNLDEITYQKIIRVLSD